MEGYGSSPPGWTSNDQVKPAPHPHSCAASVPCGHDCARNEAPHVSAVYRLRFLRELEKQVAM